MTDRSDGGDRPRTASIVARIPHLAVVCLCALVVAPAIGDAQPRRRPEKPAKPAPAAPAPKPDAPVKPAGQPENTGAGTTAAAPAGKPKVFDFTGLDLAGRLRTPQLLYFLDRASEELERASLERRSFIPEMVRSIDESNL